MNKYKRELTELTNPSNEIGPLDEVIRGADVFIGLSAPGVLTVEMIRKMNNDPIIFALSNPIPGF